MINPLNSPLLMGEWFVIVANCNGAFVVQSDYAALEEALEDASDVRIYGLDSGSEFYSRNKIGNWIK